MFPFSPVGFFLCGFAIGIPAVVDASLGPCSMDLDFIVLIAVPANAPTVKVLGAIRGTLEAFAGKLSAVVKN
jgi:hypothetical protein